MAEQYPPNVVVYAKPFWKSRTIWFNAISIIVLILTNVVNGADILELDIRTIFWVNTVIAALIAVGNVYFRTETQAPIAGTDKQVQLVPGPEDSIKY